MQNTQELSIEKILPKMPPRSWVAFAASCCERMLPNYEAFSKEVSWGDARVLRNALDFVWRSLLVDSSDQEAVQMHIGSCECVIPDTEDFLSPLTSSALDAAASVEETLQCMLETDVNRAIDVSRLAADSVHMYIQHRDQLDPSRSDFDTMIERDPLMKSEREAQGLALKILLQENKPFGDLIHELKKTFHGGGSLRLL